MDFALTMTSDSEIKFKSTAHLYQRLIARAHGGKLGLDKDFTQVCYDLDIYIYRKTASLLPTRILLVNSEQCWAKRRENILPTRMIGQRDLLSIDLKTRSNITSHLLPTGSSKVRVRLGQTEKLWSNTGSQRHLTFEKYFTAFTHKRSLYEV